MPERIRVLNPNTVVTMRQMMERVTVVPGGTGHAAKVVGYTTAGKTGTAQIFDFQHRVYTHKYNASFMGFVPVVNPRIVMVVTVTGTTGDGRIWRTTPRPPRFRRVAEVAMRLIGVPRDMPDDVKLAEPKPRPGTTTTIVALASLSDPPTDQELLEALGERRRSQSSRASLYRARGAQIDRHDRTAKWCRSRPRRGCWWK